MSSKRIVLAAAGILVAAGAVAAAAQGYRGGWRGDHMMFDQDGGSGGMRGRSGRTMTKDEFDARARERFARLDKNGDNVIDTAEIEAAINARMAARQQRLGIAPGTMGERMLHRMGAGPDGKLTRDQFRAELTRRFNELDLNNSGRIDDEDLPPMMRGRNVISDAGIRSYRPLRWLVRLGVQPKNGVITREDVLAAGDRQFDRLDRSKDGVIDKADLDALRKEMVDYRVKRFLHRFGADKDGRVTRDQFTAKANELFARLDVNGNGTITRDEMRGWGRGWRHASSRQGMMGHHHGQMGGGMMRQGGSGGQGQTGEPPTKN